jgi:hypothetical protein
MGAWDEHAARDLDTRERLRAFIERYAEEIDALAEDEDDDEDEDEDEERDVDPEWGTPDG